MDKPKNTPVDRISISLPEDLHAELDLMVAERGYESRSQAIKDMLRQYLVEHKVQNGKQVMVGTITLLYNNAANGLQKTLADLQYRHVNEVISSLHVHLMDNQTMEVILVQGPVELLQSIANAMITLRGIITGKLQLVSAVMPPLHPMNKTMNQTMNQNTNKPKS